MVCLIFQEQLGENLATEAEKFLSNLLCFNVEKPIRMKFIEGCLDNLARNRQVLQIYFEAIDSECKIDPGFYSGGNSCAFEVF